MNTQRYGYNMADRSHLDTNLRIIIIQHIASGTVAMELIVRYGLKATLGAAHHVVTKYNEAKKKYSIKNAYEVIDQCEIMFPIDKYPEKYI